MAKSSAEAEYTTSAEGVWELIQMNRLLDDLIILIQEPMELFSDSKSTICVVYSPIQHDNINDEAHKD